jgi:predicted phosphate transport protein (TIGR00153 family)
MSWNILRPRRNNFLELLEKQTAKTREGIEALEAYLKTLDPESSRKVEAIEKEADEYRRVLIDELNHSFVTPIDREDLFSLSRAIDDVLDYAYSTVDEIEMLGVHPTEHLRGMVSVVREAVQELYLAVVEIKSHPQVAVQHAVRAKKLENRAEQMYREALADLFNGAKTVEDVLTILKTREIYRHLSNAADRGDEAANIISDVVVKMT